ncbi:MAG TPA: HEPN domain-containing protein [Bacteroidales bacterium]|nr:HEPN domain-containing protein [Bacteroidales bacterium]
MNNEANEYLKNWIFRAKEDIAVIDNLYKTDPNIYASTICFHAQQAVEKFLKAFLVYHNIDFPRTHDVDFLLLECKKIDSTDFDVDLGSLSDFGVNIRYPDDFYIPDKEETVQYRDVAHTIQEIVEKKIKLPR